MIVNPEGGILILEVKGGLVNKKEGHWYQNECGEDCWGGGGATPGSGTYQIPQIV